MINHARTLLLNTTQANAVIRPETGAEYVPADFRPVNLSPPLRTLRRVLFGSDPDVRFLNLRVRELMGYIHQTELAEFVYALDPRVTYWPVQEEAFFDSSRKTLTITQIKGAPRRIAVTGTFQANNSLGRTLQQYLLTMGDEVLSPSATRTVALLQRLGRIGPDIAEEVGDAGNPAILTLPDTTLKARLDSNTNTAQYYGRLLTEVNDILVLEEYASSGFLLENSDPQILPVSPSVAFNSVTAQWTITAKASPAPVITTLMPALELLGEPVFLDLFGVSPAEPYRTFKNLWFDHYAPAYRLAGLTLAAIYRTEELRRNPNG